MTALPALAGSCPLFLVGLNNTIVGTPSILKLYR